MSFEIFGCRRGPAGWLSVAGPDYLESGGVTGVGLIILELRLLRLFKLLAWLVAADKRELEEIIGRLAGRGMAPGGRLPRTGKSGGLEAPSLHSSQFLAVDLRAPFLCPLTFL